MKRVLIALAGVIVALGLAVTVAPEWASRSTPYVRERIVSALNEHFDSRVDVDALQVTLVPHPALSGSGLTLRYSVGNDLSPLVHISAFAADATLWGLLAHPLHLGRVTLDGLDIRIPPGGADLPDSRGRHSAAGAIAKTTPLIVDEIASRHARLVLPSHRPDRLPRVFEIEDLILDGFGRADGARFRAALTNPIPRGRIDTTGTLGRWNTTTPEQTAVRGAYSFTHANLGDIKGIAGTLSSTGTYDGMLERLVVEGQTDTPDFRIDIAGAPVPLSTRFRAVVDGTNGDTWLDRVDARLGESSITATGEVVRAQDVKGRRVALDIRMTEARIEDLMRLAVNTPKPPLAGRIDLTTKFVLPAGDTPVPDRLQLDGTFTLAQAHFSNIDVQRRITLLSQRGRGDDNGDGTGESVVSNLKGRFTLRRAQLHFSELAFSVPGAQVQLAGSYDLHSQILDFAGDLLMDASLADMTHGIKSVLARLAQPFFRRPGGGSKLPIRITGTRTHPSFRVDLRRVFTRG